jgi:hypothetical protein
MGGGNRKQIAPFDAQDHCFPSPCNDALVSFGVFMQDKGRFKKYPLTSSADLNLNGDTWSSEVVASQGPDNDISLFSSENFFLVLTLAARALRSADSTTFDVLPSWSAASHGRSKCVARDSKETYIHPPPQYLFSVELHLKIGLCLGGSLELLIGQTPQFVFT